MKTQSHFHHAAYWLNWLFIIILLKIIIAQQHKRLSIVKQKLRKCIYSATRFMFGFITVHHWEDLIANFGTLSYKKNISMEIAKLQLLFLDHQRHLSSAERARAHSWKCILFKGQVWIGGFNPVIFGNRKKQLFFKALFTNRSISATL